MGLPTLTSGDSSFKYPGFCPEHSLPDCGENPMENFYVDFLSKCLGIYVGTYTLRVRDDVGISRLMPAMGCSNAMPHSKRRNGQRICCFLVILKAAKPWSY